LESVCKPPPTTHTGGVYKFQWKPRGGGLQTVTVEIYCCKSVFMNKNC